MGGFYIMPKAGTKGNVDGQVNVEAIGVVQSYEDEYIPVTGFDPAVNSSGAIHRRDPTRREASPNSPLPGGNWRG